MDALLNSAESDKAIEESQEMTCPYSPSSSPHFSPLRLPYPCSPTPRNSEESDKTIEESQEMTCYSIPPLPTDSSPLRSPLSWSPTELPWSPSYLLDESPTDFSQLSTDFRQSSTHVLLSPPRPFSPLPEPSPLSSSVVACRGSNQSMETPPHFQQHEANMIFPRCWQNPKLKLEQQQLLQLQLVPKLQELLHQRRLSLLELRQQQMLERQKQQDLLQLQQLEPQQKQQVLERQKQQVLQKQQQYLLQLQQMQQLETQMQQLETQLQLRRLLLLQLLELKRQQLPPLQKNSSDTLNLNPTTNIGTFNTTEEAAITLDRMVVRPSFLNKNIVEPKTAHIIEIPQWSAQQEDDQDENSVFGCKEATGNDEIEATGEDQMAEGGLNFEILGKRKWKVKTLGGERETKKSGAKIAIPLEDILQVKGMSLKEAAIKLNVSDSTLKRVCREHGIRRWPPRENNKLISNSLPTETPMDIDQVQIPQSNSNILPPNQASASIDTNTVTVKARRENEITIKFQLSSPWRRVELEQQVEMRLPLEAGTYYIKYKDEENELIWIGCDEDLEDYISTSTSMGASSIDVFLVPK